LVRGLSIGFQPLEHARIEGTYGYRFMKWLWLELSAVTIPANADASIQTIKSLDVGRPAATGNGPDSSNTPGVTGTVRAKSRSGRSMKTTAEKILDIKSTRAAKLETLNKLNDDVPDGETMSVEALDQCKDLEVEIKACDSELERLERLEELNKSRPPRQCVARRRKRPPRRVTPARAAS
jgi:hypothetical protein